MSTTAQSAAPRSHRISATRLAVTGALFMGVFYVLCWAGAALGIVPVSHMYLQLFSTAAMGSAGMVIEGTLWSLTFGLLAGALIAVLYNALSRLDRAS